MPEDVQEMTIVETFKELRKGLKTLRPIDWLAIAVGFAISIGFIGLLIYLSEHNINAFINVVWVGMILGATCLSFIIVLALNSSNPRK